MTAGYGRLRRKRTVLAGLVVAALAVDAAWAGSPHGAGVRTQYVQYCSGCHLPDGRGSPSTGVPALRERLDEYLKVEGGRQYIVQVPGVMNTPLNDEQTAALMNWLIDAMTPGGAPPDFVPYTAGEIAQLRASRPHDIYARRQELLGRLALIGLPRDPLR